jgi:hypothetical protein
MSLARDQSSGASKGCAARTSRCARQAAYRLVMAAPYFRSPYELYQSHDRATSHGDECVRWRMPGRQIARRTVDGAGDPEARHRSRNVPGGT